jgi:hypothetical protein
LLRSQKRRAIEARYIAIGFVKTHQPMDDFNFTKGRLDGRRGVLACGTDLDERTQQGPGAAYFI